MAIFKGKRRLMVTVALTVAMVLSLILIRAHFNRSLASGVPNTLHLAQVVDTNPDPDIVETTIIAEEATVDIGQGVMAHVLTYNGTVPGPLFRLKVGDTVIVHFENHLPQGTAIHWHGIELDNASDGTPLTQNGVLPNGTFLYKFKIRRPGIFWYHPHHQSSTNQVFQGLYGVIIVTDPNEAPLINAGIIPGPTQTATLVLSDITVCKAMGSNDDPTYDPSLPWVGGSPFPRQGGPTPKSLCESSPIDENGDTRAPYNVGDVPNVQPKDKGAVNEGQTVLTDGTNVGGRAGSPDAPGALSLGAYIRDVKAGEGLRLQIANTAATRFFNLHLTDSSGTTIPLVRIGGEGGLLDHAVVDGGVIEGFDFHYPSGQILLDPADRADVVVAIPPTEPIGSVLTLWTEDFPRHGSFSPGGGFSKIPTVPVMHLYVTGTAGSVYSIQEGTPLLEATNHTVTVLDPPTNTLLDPTQFTQPKNGMAGQDIRFTNIDPSTGVSGMLGINSVQGGHNFTGDYTGIEHMGSARYAALGDTLQLSVTNVTGAHHPFHLHGFSIQPISLTDTMPCGVKDDPSYPSDCFTSDMASGDGGTNDASPGVGPSYTFLYPEFIDNIDVPGGYTLTFRVRLDDRPLMDGTTLGGALGRWFFHCHIFFHATFGMISEFDVVGPDGNERPYINADGTTITGTAGDFLHMTGTYHDPDGDTVTLSASEGTIRNNNDGTWVWSGLATGSRLVYVTATDPGGHKDQVAFALDVTAPDLVMTAVTSNTTTVNAGATLSVTDTVANQGNLASGNSRIAYHLSLDQIYDNGDDVVLSPTRPVTSLAAGDSNTATTSLSVPSSAQGGLYYLCANANPGRTFIESDFTNNVRCSSTTITIPLPDLLLGKIATNATTVTAGTSFPLAFAIYNQGGSNAVGLFVTDFHLSTDENYGGGDDTSISQLSLNFVGAGSNYTNASFSVVAPKSMPSGEYYVCGMTDINNTVVESDDDNNTTSHHCAGPITITNSSPPPGTLPDLVMTAVTPNAATAKKGGTLSVTTTVANQGGATGTTFRIGFHLSGDPIYGGPDDVAITVTQVIKYGVRAGDSSTGTTSLTLPGATPSGVYHVCAWADSLHQVAESEEENNMLCSTTQVTVP
jgi:FtsP/CotA-like multicopper oxidase with cupredoxin domain/subtilase family serine protease